MENPKIMVVEDENSVALDIKNRLKKLGYTVAGTASTGENAIKKAKKDHPDLVLVDIVLKGEIDGIEVARYIHNNLDIPVVYLTAYADDELIERAKHTEPYGYILKPFQDKDLRSNIEIALYNKYITNSN
ncbi:response regulator receiver protein [Methanohalobium evestigatum Z-7303]|uniref:Response regulator receiver protein n=1 Tax=Methanohalobium evestigatum (strain ATCC BAA-1072 / DSM 3721 / NBRC 107634 / OCM 161 / Z-7303) TaxID=644295 RepID=D7E7F0_METEZ|nr:response regulator [Methanohalobium evestigatum]ADI73899.1 response regulator receiver protein [Methanohalobium evestigatum Z-7303]